MASSYSSAEIFALASDGIQYAKWNANEPDVDFLSHTRNCIAVIMQNELTEKQRTYLLMYVVENKTLDQIASEMGVNKSTASRVVKAGRKKMAKFLAYTAPHLLNAQREERNRR